MTCTLMVRAGEPGCFGYRAVMLATRLGTRSKLIGVSLLLDRLSAWLTLLVPLRTGGFRKTIRCYHRILNALGVTLDVPVVELHVAFDCIHLGPNLRRSIAMRE